VAIQDLTPITHHILIQDICVKNEDLTPIKLD